MKRQVRIFTITAFLATLVFGTSCLPLPGVSFAAETSESTTTIEGTMAGLSDEQVRQLLIDELKKDALSEEPEPQRMKGPAYVLSAMLRGLSSEHNENEDQLQMLFAGIPHVLPDLNKVFLNL